MGKKESPVQAGATATKTHCSAEGCRQSDHRFGFCGEHYEQFKFGLITKTGKNVPDYEKKFEHYQAFKARVAQKAA